MLIISNDHMEKVVMIFSMENDLNWYLQKRVIVNWRNFSDM